MFPLPTPMQKDTFMRHVDDALEGITAFAKRVSLSQPTLRVSDTRLSGRKATNTDSWGGVYQSM
jgi:hypothetical protein